MACCSYTTSDVFSLRDSGRHGGLIFYVADNGDGTYTYYETEPTYDSDTGYSWIQLALQSTAIGASAQGDQIGDGVTNTAAIIAGGATSGAVYQCTQTASHTASLNKLYIDRVLTPTGFDGTENIDWEAIEVIQSPAELEKLGKFVIGGKEIDGTDYFIWAELLTTLGIMGEADTDYYLINIEN